MKLNKTVNICVHNLIFTYDVVGPIALKRRSRSFISDYISSMECVSSPNRVVVDDFQRRYYQVWRWCQYHFNLEGDYMKNLLYIVGQQDGTVQSATGE